MTYESEIEYYDLECPECFLKFTGYIRKNIDGGAPELTMFIIKEPRESAVSYSRIIGNQIEFECKNQQCCNFFLVDKK